MSPTLLARLRRVEMMVHRWQQSTYREERASGSQWRARYYSHRSCWPDALTLAARARNRDLFT